MNIVLAILLDLATQVMVIWAWRKGARRVRLPMTWFDVIGCLIFVHAALIWIAPTTTVASTPTAPALVMAK